MRWQNFYLGVPPPLSGVHLMVNSNGHVFICIKSLRLKNEVTLKVWVTPQAHEGIQWYHVCKILRLLHSALPPVGIVAVLVTWCRWSDWVHPNFCTKIEGFSDLLNRQVGKLKRSRKEVINWNIRHQLPEAQEMLLTQLLEALPISQFPSPSSNWMAPRGYFHYRE